MPMKNHAAVATPVQQAGVVLLEGLVAILIFTIGIIGLMSLQAAMITNTTESRNRIEAGYIAQQRLATIWTTEESSRGDLSETDTDIAADSGLIDGKRSTIRGDAGVGCNSNPACYIVIVRWRTMAGGGEHNYTIMSYIN